MKGCPDCEKRAEQNRRNVSKHRLRKKGLLGTQTERGFVPQQVKAKSTVKSKTEPVGEDEIGGFTPGSSTDNDDPSGG